ncbi:hypothetical protein AGR8A_pTi20173 [Agrobacterium fabrum str. J-07]|nr:hypothetical protein AGR8A_pTi20173 [Agrobacterium fabrum str. J-07]
MPMALMSVVTGTSVVGETSTDKACCALALVRVTAVAGKTAIGSINFQCVLAAPPAAATKATKAPFTHFI